MKKKKIGVMTDLLLIGGVQKGAIEQVRELNKLGHKATLLIQMRKKYSTDFSYLLKKIPHQYLSDSYPPIFRKSIKLPIFSFLSTLHLLSPILSLNVIKTKEYDLIISWGTTTCLTSNTLFRFRKIPYIAIIHDPIAYILDKAYAKTLLRLTFPFLKPVVKKFEAACIREAKKTIVISSVHYEYIKKSYGVKPVVIPLGIKIPKIVPKRRGDTILSFARWQKAKNPTFLLKLAREFPKEKFVIAGSWIDKNEYLWFKNLIKMQNLQTQVKLVPHYTDQELAILCKKARLWLHPHFEAFGLAALEAASYGLPIIFPAGSGMSESFKHRINGFFPARVSIKEYSKYINFLLSDKKLAERMGQKAREVVKQKFSWSSKVQELLKYVN